MPKMMLPATQTSCLKDSHTNSHVNIGTSISFEADDNSYAKTSAGNIRTSCLKYAHTNIFFYVGVSIRYFGSYPCLYAKNDATSNMN